MQNKVIQSLQTATKGKKLINMCHTLDEGTDIAILPVPQEIWYKYPTLDEDILRPVLPCHRPFPNSNRDRLYTYDMVIWKMLADGYIQKMEEELLFFSFKKSTNLEEACDEYGFKELMPNYKLFKEIQDKNMLSDFGVDPEHGEIPFIKEKVENIEYENIVKNLGEKFVVQFSVNPQGYSSSGGRDTYVIENIDQYEKVSSKDYATSARISKFVVGSELGINAIATNRGTIVLDPYMQAIGIPELTENTSMFCGIDYSMGKQLPEEIKTKIREITRHVGDILHKKHYQGIFGIDFMWEEKTGKVYVLEINPRFTGATNMINYLCERQKLLPPIALHFCEYLDCIPESFSIEEYEEKMKGRFAGGFVYVRNREKKTVQATKAPLPGIYTQTDNTMIFKSEAYGAHQLQDESEFLVKQIHPLKRNIGPVERLFVIQSLKGTLINSHKITGEMKNAIETLYPQMEFIPENTYDSSVPYFTEIV